MKGPFSCNAANAFQPYLALQKIFHEVAIDGVAYRSGFQNQGKWFAGKVRNAPCTPRRRAATLRNFSNVAVRQVDVDHLYAGEGRVKEFAAQDQDPKSEDDTKESGLVLEDHDNVDAPGKVSNGLDRSAKGAPRYRSIKLSEIAEKKATGHGGESLEYTGQYVQPTNNAEVWAQKLPWINGLDLSDKRVHPTTRLGSEIAAFAEWSRPTQIEVAAREALIKQTTEVINEEATKFKVEPFGSARNGLALASSDLDLRIYQEWKADNNQPAASWMPSEPLTIPPRRRMRRENLSALKHLRNVFMEHPDYMMCNLRFARYPLLHMQHRPSGMDVQIVGANDTSLQRAWIKAQLDNKPHLADLYAVLKTLLELRGLTDVFRGGLGSYAIFTMIVAALNQREVDEVTRSRARRVRASDDHRQLGIDMLNVSRFWVGIDTYKNAVSVEPMALLPKLEVEETQMLEEFDGFDTAHRELRILDQSQPYLLCLIDPNDSTNDLGRQAYGWKHIQETLKYLFNGVIAKLKPEYSKPFSSFLGPALGASVHDLSHRRQRMEAYGRAALEAPNGIPESFSHTVAFVRRIKIGPVDDRIASGKASDQFSKTESRSSRRQYGTVDIGGLKGARDLADHSSTAESTHDPVEGETSENKSLNILSSLGEKRTRRDQRQLLVQHKLPHLGGKTL